MLLRSLLVLLACLALAFIATPAQAQQVQLAWDAPVQTNGSPVPNLAGYKLYYGSQSGQYPTMIQVGLKTTYTVTNLSAGQTYYFAAKAYDTTGPGKRILQRGQRDTPKDSARRDAQRRARLDHCGPGHCLSVDGEPCHLL